MKPPSFSRSWILPLALLCLSAGPQDPVVNRITTNLMCICGCPHQIQHCGDECGVAPQLVGEIVQMLEEGKTEGQVYAAFESRYGSRVYAAPKPEGFNLLAWILPFLALAFGGVLVVVVIRRLKPQGVESPEVRVEEKNQERYRKLLERELRE